MRRQALLNRDNPPTFHLILGETVLHQEVGGKAVLQAQLTRLITLAKQPNITIQVMPFSAGQHPAQGTTFTLLTVGIGAEPTTWACIETLTKLDCQPEPGHVRVYELVFDRVAINALGERESLTRIRQARDALN